MRYLIFVGILVLGYFNFKWAWIALLGILATNAFVAWFQAYVAKRRIRMSGYSNNPHLSIEANELYSAYPQFYDTPKAAQAMVETSNILWFAGLVLAVWGAFYQFWFGFVFLVIGFLLATLTTVNFKPSSKKDNLQELHEEIMAHKANAFVQRMVSERANNAVDE